MKKAVILILVLVLATGLLSACGGQKDSEKLQIVTTVFPEYDWVKNVLGQHSRSAEITLLCDNGVDMHSYQPTAEDIMKISTCDLFIYVGGESDEWVGDLESTERDEKKLTEFKRLREEIDACADCPFYPDCFRLTLCEEAAHCHPEEREEKLEETRQSLLSFYQKRKDEVSD